MRSHSCFAALILIGIGANVTVSQTIPERARTHSKDPIVAGVFRDITPLPLADLSKQSELIVVARLEFTRSYLTEDQSDILSDFTLQIEQLVAGSLPPLGAVHGRPVLSTLTVYGGTVTIDGDTVSAVDHNLEFPNSGHEYLLFLRPFGSEHGRYQTVHGATFEIQHDSLRALLKSPDAAASYSDLTQHTLPEIARG